MDGARGRFKKRRLERDWVSAHFCGNGALMRHLSLAAAFFLCCAIPAHAQQLDPLQSALNPYAFYQSGVSASLDADITSSGAMDASLARAAQYDAALLARGRLAYAALTAAQSPAFVAGVQLRVRVAGRAAVLRQLQRDPTYARRRPSGAAEASALVLASIAGDAARLRAASAHYETIGNSIGSAAWNIPLDTTHRDARMLELRALASRAPVLASELAAGVHVAAGAGSPLQNRDAFGGTGFWDALGGRAAAAPQPSQPRLRRERAAVMDRVLTAAGLFIIGATPSEGARVNALLEDGPAHACLTLQQLEFRQCVSVSHTPDEDAFCLSRHGLGGVADCLGAMLQ
jgi:hypothetical protein